MHIKEIQMTSQTHNGALGCFRGVSIILASNFYLKKLVFQWSICTL